MVQMYFASLRADVVSQVSVKVVLSSTGFAVLHVNELAVLHVIVGVAGTSLATSIR